MLIQQLDHVFLANKIAKIAQLIGNPLFFFLFYF